MEPHSDFYRSLKDSDNGYFTVESRNGRAYLCVYPPGKKGRAVSYSDVLARLELFKLKDYDRAMVQEYVLNADAVPRDICAWKDDASRDAVLSLEISEDAMEAKLVYEPPSGGGRQPSGDDLLKIIAGEGIVYGILEDAVEKFAADLPDQKTELIVARGTPCRKGKNAVIRHYFSPNPRAVPETDPENPDRVDFRKLNVIQSAEKDSLLAEIIPGLQGEEGVNIKGEVDETQKPINAKLIAGRNVRLSDAKDRIFSEIAGHVRIYYDPEKNCSLFDVEEILILEDVDYSTGHINFPGTVIINGTVLDGFEVKARGDLLIKNTVGNVKLSSEGEVVLGGIVGRGSALVTSNGDFYSRYVQDAGIHAGGSIYIEESAINSRLTAGSRIVIVEGRGELIGGESLCSQYVRVKKMGARMESSTRITVGLDLETVAALRSLEEENLDKKNTMNKILTHISQIDEYRKSNPEAAKKEDETYEKLLILREKYAKMLKNISLQMSKLGASVKPDESSFVEVLETVFPGVEVSFGTGIKNYRVENRPVHQYSRFLIEDGRILLRHS